MSLLWRDLPEDGAIKAELAQDASDVKPSN
jgi:hypothetical protein